MRPLTTLLLAAGLLLAPPAQAQSFDYDEITERTFDVASGGQLEVDTDLGQVHIRGTGGDQIRVRVTEGVDGRRSSAEDLFERFEVDFRETRRGLEIVGTFDGDRRSWWRRTRGLRVIYEIEVPQRYDVYVKTAGGSVAVVDLDGEADLHTSGGSITARSVTGPLLARTSGGSITAEAIGDLTELRTSGGSITAEAIDGDLLARTSGGSITARDVQGIAEVKTSGGSIRLNRMRGAVDAQTSGGSITADLLERPDRDMTLRTSGGSVTIVLPQDTAVDLDAKASGGRVRSDLPITVSGEISKNELRGEINGGGPRLTLRSSGGNVNLRAQ